MRSMSDTRRMFQYFLTPEKGDAARFDPARSNASKRAASPFSGDMLHLRCDPALLENAGDDLIERRVLHAHVNNGVTIKDDAEHLGDTRAVHLQIGGRPFPAGHFAELFQVVRRRLPGELQLDELRLANALGDAGQ